MFSHATFAPEEEPSARRLSLRVFEENGKVGLELPCPAHRSDHCSVYADRPSACREYRCLLLRRYEAGEIERAEALGMVAEARRRFAALRALVGATDAGDASGMDLWAVVNANLESEGGFADTVAWRRAHQAILLEVATVQAFISRHFQQNFWKRPARSQGEHLEGGG